MQLMNTQFTMKYEYINIKLISIFVICTTLISGKLTLNVDNLKNESFLIYNSDGFIPDHAWYNNADDNLTYRTVINGPHSNFEIEKYAEENSPQSRFKRSKQANEKNDEGAKKSTVKDKNKEVNNELKTKETKEIEDNGRENMEAKEKKNIEAKEKKDMETKSKKAEAVKKETPKKEKNTKVNMGKKKKVKKKTKKKVKHKKKKRKKVKRKKKRKKKKRKKKNKRKARKKNKKYKKHKTKKGQKNTKGKKIESKNNFFPMYLMQSKCKSDDVKCRMKSICEKSKNKPECVLCAKGTLEKYAIPNNWTDFTLNLKLQFCINKQHKCLKTSYKCYCGKDDNLCKQCAKSSLDGKLKSKLIKLPEEKICEAIANDCKDKIAIAKKNYSVKNTPIYLQKDTCKVKEIDCSVTNFYCKNIEDKRCDKCARDALTKHAIKKNWDSFTTTTLINRCMHSSKKHCGSSKCYCAESDELCHICVSEKLKELGHEKVKKMKLHKLSERLWNNCEYDIKKYRKMAEAKRKHKKSAKVVLYSQWSSWTKCSTSRTRSRERKCVGSKTVCKGKKPQIVKIYCTNKPSSVNSACISGRTSSDSMLIGVFSVIVVNQITWIIS